MEGGQRVNGGVTAGYYCVTSREKCLRGEGGQAYRENNIPTCMTPGSAIGDDMEISYVHLHNYLFFSDFFSGY